jgi:hypothetical protein
VRALVNVGIRGRQDKIAAHWMPPLLLSRVNKRQEWLVSSQTGREKRAKAGWCTYLDLATALLENKHFMTRLAQCCCCCEAYSQY